MNVHRECWTIDLGWFSQLRWQSTLSRIPYGPRGKFCHWYCVLKRPEFKRTNMFTSSECFADFAEVYLMFVWVWYRTGMDVNMIIQWNLFEYLSSACVTNLNMNDEENVILRWHWSVMASDNASLFDKSLFWVCHS